MEEFHRIPFVGAATRDNDFDMSAPADRPIWEQHPLWLDRQRLEAISDRMWLEIQKVMFPGHQRRLRRSPGKTELTVVGGASVEDVFSEALNTLLRYEPHGDVSWEAIGITIAQRRAVAAVRTATKHRGLPDGTEIGIMSLDLENEQGERLVDAQPDPDALADDEVIDQILRADRVLAIRKVAEDILPQRDRDIFFRFTRGETKVAIAKDVGLSGQRVGQIYRESVRKINATLRSDPTFRRLYEPKGGNPND